MQPLNKNERKKAFWNFLILFLLCITLMFVVVFAGEYIPFKDIERLQKDKSQMEAEHKFTDDFRKNMSGIIVGLDSIVKASSDPSLTELNVKADIEKLVLMAKDSVYNFELYQDMAGVLNNLLGIQKAYRNQLRDNNKTQDVEDKIDGLKRQLTTANDTISALKGTINSLKGIR